MKRQQKLMEKAQAYKREIFESQYFTERKEVYSIETFYKLPKDERIMTTGFVDVCGSKIEVPIIKEGVDTEILLYRFFIYMNEYFIPTIEKVKSSDPKEIKVLRSKKRFKKWYAQNKERILHMVVE